VLPGFRPGESELEVAVRRNNPFVFAAGADNLTSAGSGGTRGTLSVTDMNVTGHGDTLAVYGGVSGGRGIGSVVYSVSLNARNTTLQAEFALDHARIIEEPFDRIDIKSRTSRGALFLFHPWILHPNRSLTGSIGLERRHSFSTLLGLPFSFSPGDREGKSDTSVFNVGAEYTARGRNEVLAVRGTVRRGINLFQPTIHDNAPDGRFTAFVGQLQYARTLGPNGSELLFRWTGQLSADPLLALEKMPVGGFNTVRGYRENQFVRDNGQAASVEWRVPIRRLSTGEEFAPLNLQVAPFVDTGWSWDVKNGITDPGVEDIQSAGVGLLWNPLRALRLDVYWGHAFRDVGNPGNNLQDKGVHFRFQYAYSF
jgi:hemolysin activation/secretion protein